MDRELEPLPPEVSKLLAAERAAQPDVPPSVRTRLRARIFATLGLVVGGGAVATTAAVVKTGGILTHWASLSLKAKVLFALATAGAGLAIPVVAWKVNSSHEQAVQVRAPALPAPVAAPRPVVSPAPPAPALLPPSPPPPVQAPLPAAGSPRHLTAESDIAAERALIERARVHFMHGQAAQALWALRQHSQRYPQGELREERESLWIRVLMMQGEVAAAREKAKHFRQTFPRSIFLPVIEPALTE